MIDELPRQVNAIGDCFILVMAQSLIHCEHEKIPIIKIVVINGLIFPPNFAVDTYCSLSTTMTG